MFNDPKKVGAFIPNCQFLYPGGAGDPTDAKNAALKGLWQVFYRLCGLRRTALSGLLLCQSTHMLQYTSSNGFGSVSDGLDIGGSCEESSIESFDYRPIAWIDDVNTKGKVCGPDGAA